MSRYATATTLLLAIAITLVAARASAQIAPSMTYLMAFHACEGSACTDPRNHRVYLAESNDALTWTGVPGWTPLEGSVPDVIQRDRTLYVYTASPFVQRFNLDTGESNRVAVRVNGLPSGVPTNWVDPSLTIDDQGRLVLFLMYAPAGSGDPARCRSGETSCVRQFLSATEVAGSDGTEFVVDPDARATVTLSSSTFPQSASDPDIFFDGTRYVLYLSHGPSISVWTSQELRGSYALTTTLPSGMLSDMRGGVPAGHYDGGTHRYWTFAHTARNGVSTIRRAVHADFSRQLDDSAWSTAITGASIGLGATISVESPSFTIFSPPQPR